MANGNDNPLLYAAQSDPVPTAWTPSTWRPGMPPTAENVDTSQYPMPTQDQIEAQRQAITARLRQYGYPAQQLSDQQVLGTMSNLPQRPVQWEPWVQDWMNRNPGNQNLGARPGVDMPTNQTFEDYNLRTRGLGPTPTEIGSAYAIPRGAMIEHYGQAAVDDQDKQWIVEHSTPGATLRLVDPTHPGGYDVTVPGGRQAAPAGPAMYSTTSAPATTGAMPTYGAQPYPAYASGTPGGNALASSSPAAANWVQQLQQQNPSFWDQLMRWIGLRQQHYGPGSADTGGGGFFAGGGGPQYSIGNVPVVPEARPMRFPTGL